MSLVALTSAPTDSLPESPQPLRLVTTELSPLDPLEVLDATTDDAVLLIEPDGSFELALGVAARLEAEGTKRLETLVGAAARLFARLERDPRAPSARLFGGFAFDPAGPPGGLPNAVFTLPRLRLSGARSGPVRATLALEPKTDAEQAWRAATARIKRRRRLRGTHVVEVTGPDRRSWEAEVRSALRAIRAGRIHKLVCARSTRVELTAPLPVGRVLAQLGPGPVVRYAVRQRGTSLFGASPERLVALSGRDLVVDALAGTAVAGRAAARTLLASSKEREEHAIVVEAIAAALADSCELDIPLVPVPLDLGALQHLHTPIRGQTRGRRHLLELAADLHPTPAVGGFPRGAAAELARELGAPDRGWYTGAIGWFNGSGDGSLQVVLRCGEVRDRNVRLWAGAGIVAGSTPEGELAELELKTRGALRALAGAGRGTAIRPSSRPSFSSSASCLAPSAFRPSVEAVPALRGTSQGDS